MSNFERIVAYLEDEGCPKTPNEISNWTGIPLGEVYEILSNKVFEQILDRDTLKGWIVNTMTIPQPTPYVYNCGGEIKRLKNE